MLSGKNHGEFSCPREQLLSKAVQVNYVMRHHSDRGLTQFVLFRNNDINEEDILNIIFSTNIHMQESQGSHLNNRKSPISRFKSIPASHSEAYFQRCYSEEFQRRKTNITSRLTKFPSKNNMITLVIVYWSDNTIRLVRIQERMATMIWAKYSCTVKRNQLWLMMVILDIFHNVTLDMLRQNIRW